MADDVLVANAPQTDYSVKTDEDAGGDHWQLIKLGFGGNDVFTRVETGAGLPVNIQNGTIAVTDGGGILTVDGTVGISGTVVVDSELPAAVALADGMANPTVPQVGSHLLGFNGATWDRIRAGTNGTLQVDVARVFGLATGHVPIGDALFPAEMLASGQDNVGNTVNELVTAALGYVFDGTAWDRARGDSVGGAFVQGPAAADAAAAGNPLLAGARASTAVPTAVSTDGDAVPLWALRTGALAVNLRDAAGTELAVGGGTQYDEDTASAAAEKLMMAGVVRKDVAGSLVDTDGDRTELQVDSTGALRVTGGAGGSAPSHVDKAAFTPSTDDGVPVFGMMDDATPSTLAEGEAGVIRATANRGLHVNLRTTAGVEILAGQLDAGALSTELLAVEPGIVFPIGDGTFSVEILASGADGTANTVNQLVTAALGYLFNGTSWDRMRGDTTNGLDVDVTRVSGTVTVDTELPAAAALGDTDSNPTAPAVGAFGMVWGGTTWARMRSLLGDGVAAGGSQNVSPMVYNGTNYDRLRGTTAGVLVQGAAAHDAAAAGNPVLVGGQMETIADSAPGTRAGTDGDAVKLATTDGAIFQAGRGPQSFQTRLASTSTLQTDGTIHAAPGAGLSLYVTDIIFSIGAATASSVFFEEGASTVIGPFYLEAIAGRGMALHFQTPFKVTANTALTVTNTGSTTYSIHVLGFIAPG
ncbi:MAG TPA: hypothetical protein VFQ40_06170 [Actinomycetota bacterium]|nr:hypothetical protein [Actinomycetota bacterium]